MVYIVLILVVAFFAYSNGANDNFKGVATLYGSRQVSYKTAVAWATSTTLMGSIASIFLAAALVKNFSGKGHVFVDAISGMGIANKSVDFKVLRHILLSWVLTLPCGALISFLVYLFILNL